MGKIRQEIVDELLAGYEKPADLVGPDGLLKELFGRLLETATAGELTAHLGYERHAVGGRGSGNSRNGTTSKTLLTEHGPVKVELPRDRAGTFRPGLVPKGDRRFDGFDERIIALYGGGLSLEQIQEFFKAAYSTEMSRDQLSTVIATVLEDVREWQCRPLSRVYPIVYLDGFVVKIRHDGTVSNRTVYLAIGLNIAGRKEALGMWVSGPESAKFWLKVMTELKNRGVEQILIACVDGLTGFPDAIEAVFPDTVVQNCVVHLIRASLRYVSWKDRKKIVADLKPIYKAATEDAAFDALAAFDAKWSGQYPMIAETWRRNWERFIPFLSFPADIRRVMYTTNAIESVNRQLRKIIKTRGQFPNDDSALKLLWLALRNAEKKWTYPIKEWHLALHQLDIMYPGRLGLDRDNP